MQVRHLLPLCKPVRGCSRTYILQTTCTLSAVKRKLYDRTSAELEQKALLQAPYMMNICCLHAQKQEKIADLATNATTIPQSLPARVAPKNGLLVYYPIVGGSTSAHVRPPFILSPGRGGGAYYCTS